LLSGKAGEVQF